MTGKPNAPGVTQGATVWLLLADGQPGADRAKRGQPLTHAAPMDWLHAAPSPAWGRGKVFTLPLRDGGGLGRGCPLGIDEPRTVSEPFPASRFWQRFPVVTPNAPWVSQGVTVRPADRAKRGQPLTHAAPMNWLHAAPSPARGEGRSTSPPHPRHAPKREAHGAPSPTKGRGKLRASPSPTPRRWIGWTPHPLPPGEREDQPLPLTHAML